MKNDLSLNKTIINTEKPKWWKPGIKGGHSSCLCCGETSQILDLETKLYNSYGGWNILKDGVEYFCENRDVDFDECKDINHIEELIGEDTKSEYLSQFNSPLRSAIYQRHAKNNWVLIEKGNGFA